MKTTCFLSHLTTTYNLICLKNKHKSVLVHPTRTRSGIRRKHVAPLILNLGTNRGDRSDSRPSQFTHGKEILCHLNRRPCGRQKYDRRFWRRECNLASVGIQSPDRLARSLVTIRTELSRILLHITE